MPPPKSKRAALSTEGRVFLPHLGDLARVVTPAQIQAGEAVTYRCYLLGTDLLGKCRALDLWLCNTFESTTES